MLRKRCLATTQIMSKKKILSSLLAISLIAPNVIMPISQCYAGEVIIHNLDVNKHNKIKTNDDTTVIASALGGFLGGISISDSVKLTPAINGVGDKVYMCAVSPDSPEVEGKATITCHADFATLYYTGEYCKTSLEENINATKESDRYNIPSNLNVKVYPAKQYPEFAETIKKKCNSTTPMKIKTQKGSSGYYYVTHYQVNSYCQGDSVGKTYGSGNLCTTTIDSLTSGEVTVPQLFNIQRKAINEKGETIPGPSQMLNPIVTLDVYSGTTSMANNSDTDTYSYTVDMESDYQEPKNVTYPNWQSLSDDDFTLNTGSKKTNNGGGGTGNGGGTGGGTSGGGGTGNGGGTGGGGGTGTENGGGGTGSENDGGNTIPDAKGGGTTDNGYENLVSNLLGDPDSFGAGDNDWANSNGGGTGLDDLDDYFGGVNSDLSDIPGGLTEDLLGVAGLNDEYNQDADIIEGNNDGEDTNTYTDNSYTGGYQSDDSNDDSGLSAFGIPLSDLSEQYANGLAGLDGLTGDNNGLLGLIEGTGSLADKLNSLINGDKSVMNSKNVTASNQELFDVAKKLLLASGFSLDDLKKGKNYDANSAYTEPVVAWDMNRITTLLKGKKINLNENKANNKTTNQKNSKTSKK